MLEFKNIYIHIKHNFSVFLKTAISQLSTTYFFSLILLLCFGIWTHTSKILIICASIIYD